MLQSPVWLLLAVLAMAVLLFLTLRKSGRLEQLAGLLSFICWAAIAALVLLQADVPLALKNALFYVALAASTFAYADRPFSRRRAMLAAGGLTLLAFSVLLAALPEEHFASLVLAPLQDVLVAGFLLPGLGLLLLLSGCWPVSRAAKQQPPA